MSLDVVALTQELVAIPSVSRWSNAGISDTLHQYLNALGCTIERLEYTDENGERKVSLVGKLGEGSGGLAFCSHSDTVPGQEQDWAPYTPEIKGDRLYGRGSCDMKGPLAATIVAASQINPAQLCHPLYIIVTSDEEIGLEGAKHVAAHSTMLRQHRPTGGVIAEPTRMRPVHGHKGYARIIITARGEAAHTSTDKGISANFLLAPFLAEMAELNQLVKSDPSFMNPAFDPPTNGFNMILNDNDCAFNVFAAVSTCGISFRAMPDSRADELGQLILDKATAHGLEATLDMHDPLYLSPSAPLVQAACRLTGITPPETVPYGTDGIYLQEVIDDLIILGPGDIGLAHRVGEYVPIPELHQAVSIYRQLITDFCLS